jgi:hypothetical protein
MLFFVLTKVLLVVLFEHAKAFLLGIVYLTLQADVKGTDFIRASFRIHTYFRSGIGYLNPVGELLITLMLGRVTYVVLKSLR